MFQTQGYEKENKTIFQIGENMSKTLSFRNNRKGN